MSESAEFQVISLDGKVWELECLSPEEMAQWVRVIEEQIKKIYSENVSHKRMVNKVYCLWSDWNVICCRTPAVKWRRKEFWILRETMSVLTVAKPVSSTSSLPPPLPHPLSLLFLMQIQSGPLSIMAVSSVLNVLVFIVKWEPMSPEFVPSLLTNGGLL